MENPEAPEERIATENARTENSDAASERTESTPAESIEQSESSSATLDDITLEPESVIEQSMDYAQAEEIERTLTTLVETVESTSRTARGEDASATSTESTIEATPITLPIDPPMSTVETDPVPLPIDPSMSTIEATPINTPPVPPETIANAALIPENVLDDENSLIIESVITGRDAIVNEIEIAEPNVEDRTTRESGPEVPGPENTSIENDRETPDTSAEESGSEGARLPETETAPEATDTEQTPAAEDSPESEEEEVPAESSTESEETDEGKETTADGMQVYEGEGGTPTVVDDDGHPIESPPSIIKDPATGKYYFVTETDPGKLSSFSKSGNFADALAKGLIQEAPGYTPSTEKLQVYSGEDGSPKVVDENGQAVESPPAVIKDPSTGKYYFVTETDPGKLSSFSKSGNFADALAKGLIQEAPGYTPSTEKLQVYSGEDGSPTVVDQDGHPVESPPAIIKDPSTGKYYFVTETDPGKLSSLAKGNFADALAKGVIQEAPDYTPSTDKMQVYSGGDGSPTVVDENGHAVESPPAVIKDPSTGKYYFITETDPGKSSSFNKSGNFASALANGLIQEAPGYTPSSDGMHIYSGGDGSPTVVDENGHAVESPPAVIKDPSTGKYYFVTETDPGKLSSLAKGDFASALANGLIQEAPGYTPSSDGMHIYSGGDGSPTVVDENGHAVECPPAIVQDTATGKYYFVTETDPGKLSSLAKGDFAGALAKGVIQEAPDYNPFKSGKKPAP